MIKLKGGRGRLPCVMVHFYMISGAESFPPDTRIDDRRE